MIKRIQAKRGFTLAELLVVVAIIGVLVAVSIPIFTGQLEKARKATCDANKENIRRQYIYDAMPLGLLELTGDVGGQQQALLDSVIDAQKSNCPAAKKGYTGKIVDGKPVVICTYHDDGPGAGEEVPEPDKPESTPTQQFEVSGSDNAAIKQYFASGWTEDADKDGNVYYYKTFVHGNKTYCIVLGSQSLTSVGTTQKEVSKKLGIDEKCVEVQKDGDVTSNIVNKLSVSIGVPGEMKEFTYDVSTSGLMKIVITK